MEIIIHLQNVCEF